MVTLKVTVVVAGKFCKSATSERMMAGLGLPPLFVTDPQVIALPILIKVVPSKL